MPRSSFKFSFSNSLVRPPAASVEESSTAGLAPRLCARAALGSGFGGFRARLPGGGLLNQTAPDDEALNLVRAFVNLRDLGVAHVLLNRIVFAVAVASEELHGIGRDRHRHVGGEDLAHRRELRDILRARI